MFFLVVQAILEQALELQDVQQREEIERELRVKQHTDRVERDLLLVSFEMIVHIFFVQVVQAQFPQEVSQHPSGFPTS